MIRLLSIILLCQFTPYVSAQETLTIWHSFAGSLAHQFQSMADQFNNSQSDYRVNLVYKGNYIESLTSFAAAFHAGHPPDMVQVFEVGRDAMVAAQDSLSPVDTLLTPEQVSRLLPAVKQYYSRNQILMAYPLNVSVPVMYYNKEALQKVAPNQPFPTTWQAFELVLTKLKKAGYGCGYTTAFPAWLHFESFASLHGLSLIAPDNPKAVRYKQPAIIHHLYRLKRWQQQRFFRYGGRDSDATHLFTSQTCVIFSQSSGAWQSLQKMVKFPVGIAPLPVDKDISHTRYANTFGGAALWVVKPKSPQKKSGVQAWLSFLAQPNTQWDWYLNTGYLPMVDIEHVQPQSELLKIASQDLIHAQTSAPITWGPQNQLRIILDQAMESFFSQSESVESALDYAEKQANYRLHRFDKNYHHS
jgi:sn-glycerol 3-phosphate transport system substrate-binding protein